MPLPNLAESKLQLMIFTALSAYSQQLGMIAVKCESRVGGRKMSP